MGKHDCDRCLPILKRIDARSPDIIRGMAREELFPSRSSDAETFATRVDLEWHFTEIAAALRKRRFLWETAGALPGDAEGFGGGILLTLAGCGALEDIQLKMLGEDLGAIVSRGTEPDTLLIVGI